jgi:hypothetical protein
MYLGEQEGGAASGAAAPEEGSGGPAAEDTSEEAMLQRALAMSMDGGAPDLAAMTEEEQIAYAMRMSMADSQADAAQVGIVKVIVLYSVVNSDPYKDSMGSLDPDPDSQSGSGNKFNFFEVLHVLFWGLKASPVLERTVLYGGLGISKFQSLIQKKFFFLNFWSSKPKIRIFFRIQ